MDLVVNHTSDEHPWFVESRSTRTTPKRDWYWWRPARAGTTRHARRRADQLGLVLLRPGLGVRRGDRRVLPAPVLAASSPTSTGRTRRSAQAVYAMMRWWLDRGVDGFRMDVINLISKDTALPDGPVPTAAVRRRRAALRSTGRGSTSSSHEMHREVFAGRDGTCSPSARCPGVTVERGPRCSPTRPAREVDMVFQFEHVGLDQRRGPSGTSRPLRPAATSRRPSAAGRRASPTSAGTASTGTTTTSRASCPASATTASTGWRSAKTLGHRAAPAPRHAVRLPGRGARHDERAASPTIDDFRDIESVNHYARGGRPRGATPERCWPRCAVESRDNARTPMQWDASAARRVHHRRRRGSPVNPNHAEINAAAAAATTRTRCSTTTGA